MLVLAVPTLAAAQDGRVYFGSMVGANVMEDADVTGTNINRSIELETDAAYFVSGGYIFGNPIGFRAEGELGYRLSDATKVSGQATSGEINTISAMANVLYDFDLDLPIVPYLGAGLGAVRVDFDNVTDIGVGSTKIDERDAAFGYQLAAGIYFEATESVWLTLDYRYLTVPEMKTATEDGQRVEVDYTSHAILAGVRFRLGTPIRDVGTLPRPEPKRAAARPAPSEVTVPAAPQGPPLAQRSFIVFFDRANGELTDNGRTIVRAVASTARTLGAVSIEAVAFADTSDLTGYDAALSQRRAEAVRDALVEAGVPLTNIAINWLPAAPQLVATNASGQHLHNSRAEIILR